MNTGNQTPPGGSNSSRVYFIAAICSLMLMALLWSLDSFFVYILLGTGAWFLFLGFWKNPHAASGNNTFRSDYRKTNPSPDLFSGMLRNSGKKSASQQQSSSTPTSFSGKAVLPYVIFFFASFFFMIVVPLLFSENSIAPQDLEGYFQKGEQFRWAEQYDSADYYYQLAMKEEPENVEILNAYGVGLMNRNQYDRAMTLFDQALQKDPEYELARYNKALVYYYREGYRQSLSQLFRLMKTNPGYYEAMILTGDNYYVQQKYDSALYWYDEGYDNGQRSAILCHIMGYLYDRKGDQEKAVHLYQEALSYDSSRVEIYERLGELFPGDEGEQYRMTAKQLQPEGN
jgi:Tfp pilus assembly protein PilF